LQSYLLYHAGLSSLCFCGVVVEERGECAAKGGLPGEAAATRIHPTTRNRCLLPQSLSEALRRVPGAIAAFGQSSVASSSMVVGRHRPTDEEGNHEAQD
jgi:hypothetical protein